MRHLQSISSRLTLAATLSVGLFGLLVAIVTIEWVHVDLERSMRQFAQHEVHELSNIVASAGDAEELGRRSESLAGIAPEPGLISLAVYDLRGELVYSWPSGEVFLGLWPEGLSEARAGREAWREVSRPDRPLALELASPVSFGREARWLVTVAVERERHEQEITGYVQRFALGLLILVVLTALGTRVLVRQALAPVQSLVREARLMAEESHPTSRLGAARSADELAELVAVVNRLLDRLSGTIERLEHFTAHAGHELRTPISRIRAEAEQALAESDPEVLQRTLGNILEEVDIQKRVIDALFELARSSDQLRMTDEPQVALEKIVRECAEDVGPLAEARGLSVVLEGPEGRAVVRGNQVLLVRAIWNLLDNAVKYASEGQIVVALRQDRAAVELSVTNTVADDRELDPARAFEPFVRLIGEGEPDSGLGLGLALTRSIIERHHGSVTLETTAPGARADAQGPRLVTLKLRLPRDTCEEREPPRTISDVRS